MPKNNAPKIIQGFKVPAWWECGWRRVPCGLMQCKLCGSIAKRRQKHIAAGEDPDDMKYVMEDVGESLAEAMLMVRKHAIEMGIDPDQPPPDDYEDEPESDTFPLYNYVRAWRDQVANIFDDAYQRGSMWIATEAAADVGWYMNTIRAKTYRQLCNRWRLDRGDNASDVDYIYTRYVLREATDTILRALQQLAYYDSAEKGQLILVLKDFLQLKKKVRKI